MKSICRKCKFCTEYTRYDIGGAKVEDITCARGIRDMMSISDVTLDCSNYELYKEHGWLRTEICYAILLALGLFVAVVVGMFIGGAI